MKTLITVLAMAFCFTSCKKDTSTSAESQNSSMNSNLTTGQWKITNAIKMDSTITSTYAGYRLTFDKSGHVTATNDVVTINGTWSLSIENNASVFLMVFDYIQNFGRISEDWRVKSQTSNEITLEKGYGDTPGRDYLVLTKIQ